MTSAYSYPFIKQPCVVVGMGVSGLSVARYLNARQVPFTIVDGLINDIKAQEVRSTLSYANVHQGELNDVVKWEQFATVILSPGVAKASAFVQRAVATGADVIGDIEIFAQIATSPIVGVTGSNGKSTVCDLLHSMATAAGLNAAIGGNFGTPALDLLTEQEPDLFILELSSFQLETTYSLHLKTATILNLSEDHMDRYDSFDDYVAAKLNILSHADNIVADTSLDTCISEVNVNRINVGLNVPEKDQYGVFEQDGVNYLGGYQRPIIDVDSLKILGSHNQLNSLFAIALAESVGIQQLPIVAALSKYPGLDHRCQWVADVDNVLWINDSKSTNPGSTIAALNGLAKQVILILGGQSKGNDFSPLCESIKHYAKHVLLIGDDAAMINSKVKHIVSTEFCPSLEFAVQRADELSSSNEAVLFSPACASFDMFESYADRGNQFMRLVDKQLGGAS